MTAIHELLYIIDLTTKCKKSPIFGNFKPTSDYLAKPVPEKRRFYQCSCLNFHSGAALDPLIR